MRLSDLRKHINTPWLKNVWNVTTALATETVKSYSKKFARSKTISLMPINILNSSCYATGF